MTFESTTVRITVSEEESAIADILAEIHSVGDWKAVIVDDDG